MFLYFQTFQAANRFFVSPPPSFIFVTQYSGTVNEFDLTLDTFYHNIHVHTPPLLLQSLSGFSYVQFTDFYEYPTV